MAAEVVVVTGSSGGIGSAIVERLVGDGMAVIGIDRAEQAHTPNYYHICFDLGRLAGSDQARLDLLQRIRTAQSSLGRQSVSALVNNAAVQIVKPAELLTPEEFQQTIDVNVMAPFVLARMLKSDLAACGGSIVNISSIHAELTKSGFCAYSTSKSALTALSRALAIEWGSIVRVTCIEPAAVATPMLEAGFAEDPGGRARLDAAHPSRQVGTISEVASWVRHLISDRSPYSNGTVVRVDGGIRGKLFDPANE